MKATVSLAAFSKKQIIVIGVVLLLIVTSLLLRGWIRNSVVPLYVEVKYGKQLGELADQQLVPIHDKLAPVGFVFKEYAGYVPGKKCGLAYFHNFKETVVCSAGYSAEVIAPSGQQKDMLTTQSEGLEQWLKDSGWSKEGTSYGGLANTFFDTDDASMFYQKHIGSVTCKFMVSWRGQGTPISASPTLSVATNCTREVKFFGGNDSLHS